MKKIMTKKELVIFLIENFTDQFGNLDLKGLDFSDFDGSVDISFMTVKHNLEQSCHRVFGHLNQSCHSVDGNLQQTAQQVKGDLHQSLQIVGGNLTQCLQEVGGDLDQSSQMVKGCIGAYKPSEDEAVEEREDCLVIIKKGEIRR